MNETKNKTYHNKIGYSDNVLRSFLNRKVSTFVQREHYKFHNLCEENELPPNTNDLLGLNFSFVPHPKQSRIYFESSFVNSLKEFETNIKRLYRFNPTPYPKAIQLVCKSETTSTALYFHQNNRQFICDTKKVN